MIEKLKMQDTWGECLEKLNEVIDAVNGILDYAPLEMAMKAEKECRFNPVQADREVYNALTRSENVQPDIESRSENVQQVSYIAPGDITVFHGFNCSVEFDIPLPKGTRITIKSITKGGDNE